MPHFPIENGRFHSFLSHNSRDKDAMRQLKSVLDGHGLRCWFDEDELRPGIPWVNLLEEGIENSDSVVVAIADSGIGPWEEEEMRAAIQLAVEKKIPVIPVLLPNAPNRPKLPLFLAGRTYVEFRNGLGDKTQMERLIWGITGKKSGESHAPAKGPSHGNATLWKVIATVVLIFLILCGLYVWHIFGIEPELIRQRDLVTDIAKPIASDVHNNGTLKQSLSWDQDKVKFALTLDKDSTETYMSKDVECEFENPPTLVTVEFNVHGQFTPKAFQGEVVNIIGKIDSLEKVSDVRVSVRVVDAKFTSMPK